MQHQNLTPLRVSLPLSLAVLAFSSIAGAHVTPPVTDHRWTFNEPDGAVCYDEAGGPDGNFSPSTTRVPGPFGDNAASITSTPDDPDGYVDFGNAVGALGTSDFTITHWYRTSFDAPGQLADVLGNRTAYSHGNFIAVRIRGDGTITAELDQDGWGTNYVAVWGYVWPVNDGEWHHLAYVRSGATLLIYIDGEPKDISATDSGAPTWISGASSFRLGRRLPYYGGNFTSIEASFDDLRLYDRALSDGEIYDIATGAL